MSRLHTDAVEVQRRDDLPEQFLWRGRLYVVREVLDRWTESGGWWRTAAVQSLSAGDTAGATGPLETAPLPPSPKWAQRAWGEPAPDVQAVVSPLGGVDDGERSWWRVEAGRGAAHGSGVYDLCLDEARGSWHLTRVLD